MGKQRVKLLLDTHTFLWWDMSPEKLSRRVFAALSDRSNAVHLSVVSAWEMQIKSQTGKLRLVEPLADTTAVHCARSGFIVEAVMLDDILGLAALPLHHRDPFDRLLIAQARVGGFEFVSSDPMTARYDVRLFW